MNDSSIACLGLETQAPCVRAGVATGLVWRPNGPGTGLFSRGLVTPVSWALERFTTVFGMGTGGTTPLSPPGPIGRHAKPKRVHELRAVEQTSECARRVCEDVDPADLMKLEIEARALGH